jgi:hypothetical protein
MTYSFFISGASSVVYQVYPLNWLECTLVDEKERDQVFYRRKFNGQLTFGGKKLCADFNLFNDFNADPCELIYLLILQDTDIYWEGYFTTSMGEWDLDNQTFTVTPLPIDDYFLWDEYGKVEYNILNVAPVVTVECNGWSYTRNRWLLDVIEYLAVQVFGAGTTVTSRFFTEATNYVTLKASKVLYLTIAQKSDIKNPTSTDPATVANLSFNELTSILRGRFNCYWKYSEALGIVTVEHISLFTNVPGLDLRTQEIAERSNKYRYLKEKMPKHEYWRSMEAKSADFIYGHAWYDAGCVDPDPDSNTTEYADRVTTEIEYITQSILDGDEGAISNEGFVILCNYNDGGVYRTYQMAGIYDTTIRFNMPMAWSYLLKYYHRHDRVLLDGYFNIQAQTFVSAKKIKVQDINAINCNYQSYDSEQYITTELGETYFGGEKGYVDKAVIKPYGEFNFTLLYGPSDNANEGIDADAKSFRIERVDLEVYAYLSEANIYDIYYSVWTNEAFPLSDQCDQFMIPAGTLYQMDLITNPNPIGTVSYNFTHASLTGWDISVDGSTTYDTHTDAECSSGAPAAPPVPDVPNIIGIGQIATCDPLNITWSSEVGATYYVLQRKPDYGGFSVYTTVYSGVDTDYDDANAGSQDAILFTYRVAAGNISGISAWSAEDTYTSDCAI